MTICRLLTSACLAAAAFCVAGSVRAGEENYKYGDGVFAEIKTPKGVVICKLAYDKAPLTVANFVGLAEGTRKNTHVDGKPYFDGLTFHRVEKGFVIQGGDPAGNGSGGPGYAFPDEFSPELRHDRAGTLSMANSGPCTNGSQFFITLAPTPHLDNRHSVFGYVVDGMDVAQKIEVGDRMEVKIVRAGDAAKAFNSDDKTFAALKTEALRKFLLFACGELSKQVDGVKKEVAASAEYGAEQKAMALKNIAEAESFFKEMSTDLPVMTASASGLLSAVRVPGTGAPVAKGDKVQVHYTGRLFNGMKFDSSLERGKPLPVTAGTGEVIAGWDEALLSMKRGEKRRIVVPSNLAYGENGFPDGRGGYAIPPNAMLIFDLEVLPDAPAAADPAKN